MSEALYDIDHWMVAWNPKDMDHVDPRARPGSVKVRPWPETDWSDAYVCTAGCCFVRHWPTLRTREQKLDELIRGFFYLVLGYGIDPQAVHREFSKIEGYLTYEGKLGLGKGSAVWFQDGRFDPYYP